MGREKFKGIDLTSPEWRARMEDMARRDEMHEEEEWQRHLYDASGAEEATKLNYDQFMALVECDNEKDRKRVAPRLREAARLLEAARASTPRPGPEPEEPRHPEWVEDLIDAETLRLLNGRDDIGMAQLNAAMQQAEETVLARFGLAG